MYVLVNTTTKALFHSYYVKTQFAYKKVAEKQALKYSDARHASYEVMAYEEYLAKFGNLTKTVVNLMSGEEVTIPLNTPNCCDVSSETYWSM